VPKNQYSMTINATTNTAEIHIARGMYISDMSRLYLRTLIAWLAEPSMRRFIEYSASWVSIPASIAGIPMNVWNIPVISPASIPAMNAHKSEIHML